LTTTESQTARGIRGCETRSPLPRVTEIGRVPLGHEMRVPVRGGEGRLDARSDVLNDHCGGTAAGHQSARVRSFSRAKLVAAGTVAALFAKGLDRGFIPLQNHV
jgi:hypothetical protein